MSRICDAIVIYWRKVMTARMGYWLTVYYYSLLPLRVLRRYVLARC